MCSVTLWNTMKASPLRVIYQALPNASPSVALLPSLHCMSLISQPGTRSHMFHLANIWKQNLCILISSSTRISEYTTCIPGGGNRLSVPSWGAATGIEQGSESCCSQYHLLAGFCDYIRAGEAGRGAEGACVFLGCCAGWHPPPSTAGSSNSWKAQLTWR